MRAIGLVIGVCLSAMTTLPAWANDAGDAKAVVAAIFDAYSHGHRPDNLTGYYSDELKASFDKFRQAETATVMGGTSRPKDPRPDFDPFVDAKNYLIANLNIVDPVMSGRHALVSVSYVNFDEPTELSVSLIKQPNGWKVDDVAMMVGPQHWLLSWLLKFDPAGTY